MSIKLSTLKNGLIAIILTTTFFIFAFSIPKTEITDYAYHAANIFCGRNLNLEHCLKSIDEVTADHNTHLAFTTPKQLRPLCEPRNNVTTSCVLLDQAYDDTFEHTIFPSDLFLRFWDNSYTSQFFYFILNWLSGIKLLKDPNHLILFNSICGFFLIGLSTSLLPRNQRTRNYSFILLISTPLTLWLVNSLHPSSWTIYGTAAALISQDNILNDPNKIRRNLRFSIFMFSLSIVTLSLRSGILVALAILIYAGLNNNHLNSDGISTTMKNFILVLIPSSFALASYKTQHFVIENLNSKSFFAFFHENRFSRKPYSELFQSMLGGAVNFEKTGFLANYRVSIDPAITSLLYVLILIIVLIYVIDPVIDSNFPPINNSHILRIENRIYSVFLSFFLLVLPATYFLIRNPFQANPQAHHILPYFIIFCFLITNNDLMGTRMIVQFLSLTFFLIFNAIAIHKIVLFFQDWMLFKYSSSRVEMKVVKALIEGTHYNFVWFLLIVFLFLCSFEIFKSKHLK